MKKQINAIAAGLMLILSTATSADTLNLGALNANARSFSNTFTRAGDDLGSPLGNFTDTVTFSLLSTANVSGDLNITQQTGRTTLSVGLVLTGGSLAAPIEDFSLGPFSFNDLSPGNYVLSVNGRFGGLAGVSRYVGQVSALAVAGSVPIPAAIPEPATATLLLTGLLACALGVGLRRRGLHRRDANA